jgi:hypothetical protein
MSLALVLTLMFSTLDEGDPAAGIRWIESYASDLRSGAQCRYSDGEKAMVFKLETRAGSSWCFSSGMARTSRRRLCISATTESTNSTRTAALPCSSAMRGSWTAFAPGVKLGSHQAR